MRQDILFSIKYKVVDQYTCKTVDKRFYLGCGKGTYYIGVSLKSEEINNNNSFVSRDMYSKVYKTTLHFEHLLTYLH